MTFTFNLFENLSIITRCPGFASNLNLSKLGYVKLKALQ